MACGRTKTKRTAAKSDGGAITVALRRRLTGAAADALGWVAPDGANHDSDAGRRDDSGSSVFTVADMGWRSATRGRDDSNPKAQGSSVGDRDG